MSQVSVLRAGSMVTFGDGVKAQVLLAAIGNMASVTYKLSYWDKGERKTQWVKEFEVKGEKEEETLMIGFR